MVGDMNHPREDWLRLSSYVISARKRAGFSTRRAFAAAIGVTDRTLGKLESGSRVGNDTLAAVAEGVGWTPDSPRRILAGSEPVLRETLREERPHLAAVPDAAFSQPAPDEAALREWLTILRRSDPELMRQADPVIDKLLNLPHPDGPEGRLRPFRERETLVRALLGVMSASSRGEESNSGTDGLRAVARNDPVTVPYSGNLARSPPRPEYQASPC